MIVPRVRKGTQVRYGRCNSLIKLRTPYCCLCICPSFRTQCKIPHGVNILALPVVIIINLRPPFPCSRFCSWNVTRRRNRWRPLDSKNLTQRKLTQRRSSHLLFHNPPYSTTIFDNANGLLYKLPIKLSRAVPWKGTKGTCAQGVHFKGDTI